MSQNRKTREKKVLRDAIGLVIKHLKPGKIVLFGSRAKGTCHAGSDFDLGVDQKAPGIRQERRLMEDLEKAAGLYRIDVIFLKSVDPSFRKLVVTTGRVIYEKGKGICGRKIS